MLFGLFILLSKDLVVEEGKVRIEKGIIPDPGKAEVFGAPFFMD